MSLPKRIVIATHNRKKAVEMNRILGPRFPDLEFITLVDFPGAPEPEETGTTYAENSAIKAESACAFTGLWAVADDAGLEVDAMDGRPGLYSKRYCGEETPFDIKIQHMLKEIEGAKGAERSARFCCSVALARPGEPTELFEATCEGEIGFTPSGGGGFGYDPIFWLPQLGRTMADLTADEKDAISHRGKVLAALTQRLAELD